MKNFQLPSAGNWCSEIGRVHGRSMPTPMRSPLGRSLLADGELPVGQKRSLCAQCLCGELLSNVVFRVLPHMVAIKDMKFADLFQCNGREDADGEVDDLFPESRRHALTPA